MGQAKLYGKKASGIDIDGLIQDYYVYAGKKVSAGDFVEFLNGVASQTTTTKTSSNVSFHDKEVVYLSAVKVNDNSVFVAYKSNDGSSNYFGTRVLTIDNEKITVGTEYIPGGIPYYISTTLVSTNKVAICFENVNNYKASAIIATISGTTISFGTYLSFGTGSSSYPDEYTQIEALDETHLLTIHTRQRATSSNSYGIKCCILTVDGTTLTSNGLYGIQTYRHQYLSLCKLNSTKFILSDFYVENYSANSRILTISGTTITAGSDSAFYPASSTAILSITSCKISDNKVLIAYGGNSTNYYFNCLIATISGSDITFGSVYAIDNVSTWTESCCLVGINKVLVSFNENGTNNYLQILNISGTSVISNGDKYLLGAGSYFIDSVLIGENKIITIYKSTETTNHGNSQVLGISENTISNKIKLVNTTYETQVRKATTSDIYGVTKTGGEGGDDIGHKDKVKVYVPPYGWITKTTDIIPKTWTQVTEGISYIASDGTKLTASSYYSSALTADKACDGSAEEYWGSSNDAQPSWIKLEFVTPVLITKMKILYLSTNQYISSCKIQCSNDGSEWIDLYNLPEHPSNDGVYEEAKLNNPTVSKYYRIYSEKKSSTSSPTFRDWQVSEWQEYGLLGK